MIGSTITGDEISNFKCLILGVCREFISVSLSETTVLDMTSLRAVLNSSNSDFGVRNLSLLMSDLIVTWLESCYRVLMSGTSGILEDRGVSLDGLSTFSNRIS